MPGECIPAPGKMLPHSSGRLGMAAAVRIPALRPPPGQERPSNMSWDVMFCHAGRPDPVRYVMRCHDLHARGAYAESCPGMGPWYSIRFLRLRVFGMACPFGPSPFRSSRRRLSKRRDPDSRVSCAGACARAGARIAAARLVRLIARARRRAHLSRAFLRGFFAPARTAKRSGPADAASFLLLSIITQILRCQIISKELFPENRNRDTAAACRNVIPTVVDRNLWRRRLSSCLRSFLSPRPPIRGDS